MAKKAKMTVRQYERLWNKQLAANSERLRKCKLPHHFSCLYLAEWQQCAQCGGMFTDAEATAYMQGLADGKRA